MIDSVWQYMRGDATRMEAYIELGSLVYENALSKLTMDAIQIRHADFYNLPDDSRIDTSPNSSNQKVKVLKKVTIDDFEPSKQTISPILNLEGTGTHRPVHRPEGPTHV
jgi:hypothetical protein